MFIFAFLKLGSFSRFLCFWTVWWDGKLGLQIFNAKAAKDAKGAKKIKEYKSKVNPLKKCLFNCVC